MSQLIKEDLKIINNYILTTNFAHSGFGEGTGPYQLWWPPSYQHPFYNSNKEKRLQTLIQNRKHTSKDDNVMKSFFKPSLYAENASPFNLPLSL